MSKENGVSTGAGIAIAGVWLAAVALMIVMLLQGYFDLSDVEFDPNNKGGALSALLLWLGIFCLPAAVAWFVTRMILNRD